MAPPISRKLARVSYFIIASLSKVKVWRPLTARARPRAFKFTGDFRSWSNIECDMKQHLSTLILFAIRSHI
jgi:hypothetical protein